MYSVAIVYIVLIFFQRFVVFIEFFFLAVSYSARMVSLFTTYVIVVINKVMCMFWRFGAFGAVVNEFASLLILSPFTGAVGKTCMLMSFSANSYAL